MRRCAIIVLATACTRYPRTRTLLPDTPSTLAVAELADGRKVEVRATPTPDGLRWIVQDKTGATTGAIVDPENMRSYTTLDHGRGLFDGLGLGALGGVALGAAIGLASTDDKCTSECAFALTSGDKAVLFGALFGSLGLIVGGLIGGAGGAPDVHELGTAYVPRVTATLAPGHAGGALSWSF